MANPTCVLCQKKCENEWGNNPAPLVSMAYGVCCDQCNVRHVIPARMYGVTHVLSRIILRTEEEE